MDKLTKTSLNEVTRYIDDLLTSAPMVADALAQLSLDVSDFAQLDRETFLERLTNALCARKWYEQQKPDGLPELPRSPSMLAGRYGRAATAA